MSAQKLLGMLGLCMKAGKCVSGAQACEGAARSKKAKLFVLEKSMSDGSKKHWCAVCARNGIKYIFVEGVGHAIGKSARMTVAILDENFAKSIYELGGTDFMGGN